MNLGIQTPNFSSVQFGSSAADAYNSCTNSVSGSNSQFSYDSGSGSSCKHKGSKDDKKDGGILGDIFKNIFGDLGGKKKSKKGHHSHHSHHSHNHGHGGCGGGGRSGGPSLAINICNGSRGLGF